MSISECYRLRDVSDLAAEKFSKLGGFSKGYVVKIVVDKSEI